MPRFYLNFRDGDGREADVLGRDLPDLATAHAVALQIARDLHRIWGGMPLEAQGELAFEIVDERGRTVQVVAFLEAAGRTH